MTENRIGSERTRLRLSQVELARMIGTNPKTLSQWEQGKLRCPNNKLKELARVFGCSIDYLLEMTLDRLPRTGA